MAKSKKMICILLVAGHETSLDDEIKSDESGKYFHLEGVPKALLPGVRGKTILDYWWDIIKNRQLFSEVIKFRSPLKGILLI